jgi:hypothetical protein
VGGQEEGDKRDGGDGELHFVVHWKKVNDLEANYQGLMLWIGQV